MILGSFLPQNEISKSQIKLLKTKNTLIYIIY
jgi:hypothetical protein